MQYLCDNALLYVLLQTLCTLSGVAHNLVLSRYHIHTTQVIENSNINADPRNQAVSAAADGVPFFKDRNAANGWPVVLYPENGPVGVSRSNEHAHMACLAPGEYLSENADGKRLIVKK